MTKRLLTAVAAAALCLGIAAPAFAQGQTAHNLSAPMRHRPMMHRHMMMHRPMMHHHHRMMHRGM